MSEEKFIRERYIRVAAMVNTIRAGGSNICIARCVRNIHHFYSHRKGRAYNVEHNFSLE
jgi:hypothetical protein